MVLRHLRNRLRRIQDSGKHRNNKILASRIIKLGKVPVLVNLVKIIKTKDNLVSDRINKHNLLGSDNNNSNNPDLLNNNNSLKIKAGSEHSFNETLVPLVATLAASVVMVDLMAVQTYFNSNKRNAFRFLQFIHQFKFRNWQ
jgi:hypothetical protein